ncbi:membrane protein [Bifidobacterium actinocoloniiforme DSM 22766]|nr:membrane protein [Bifidobacterium actinocoloniiforme DSM 22766]
MIMDILNGLSTGIIVALVPGALLNALVKYLLPVAPWLRPIPTMTGMAQVLLPAVSAVCVGMIAKFTPIQTSSLALAAALGAGNWKVSGKGLALAGPGDVINLAVTIAVGYLVLKLLGDMLKTYTILLLPTLVILIAGGIGMLTYGPVSSLTRWVGAGVNALTSFQPVPMGVLMGAAFALIIVSPISSVGIAAAIGVTGIAAGSANLGITAAALALAIYGRETNSVGTSLAHFLGSPKIQMANLLSRPKLLLPLTINAAIMGGVGAACGIQGTPASAGFGLSGLIGPLAAIEAQGGFTTAHVLEAALLFAILPVALGYLSDLIFTRLLDYQKPEYYAITYS